MSDINPIVPVRCTLDNVSNDLEEYAALSSIIHSAFHTRDRICSDEDLCAAMLHFERGLHEIAKEVENTNKILIVHNELV